MTFSLRRGTFGIAVAGLLACLPLPAAGQNPAAPQRQFAQPGQFAPQGPAAPQGQFAPQGPAAPQGQFAPQGQQGPPPAIRREAAPPRIPVAPFELTEPQQKYLDSILNYWEYKSQQVERFRCQFTRWEYDPVFGPKDKDTAKTESVGTIMYAAPDKGLFKVEKMYHFTAPQNAGEQPRYEERPGEVGEHWVCDGRSVFEYNHQQKKLIQYQLPDGMQGQAIANSPLPFIFGANARQIKDRFWMRVITPAEAKGEYWLEAYPKHRADAVNYQKIWIILDEQDYLPKAIEIYDPTYDPNRNRKRTAFLFQNREVNWSLALQKLNLFHKEFYEPALPSGWKKEVQHYDQAPAPQGPAAQAAAAGRARR
jgi:TIGR03009 family protein